MVAPQQTARSSPIPPLIRLKFAVSRGSLWLVLKCTSLTGLYMLGRLIGTCEYLINYKRRRRFHQRMRQYFGAQYERAKMRAACRNYFVRTRCDKLYYLVFDLLPAEKIIRRIQFPQKQTIDRAFERGHGVYIALSHLGAQHVAGLLMCFLGYKVAGVRDRDQGPLRRYIQDRFERKFSEIKAAKMFFADAFPRDIYRWFGQNALLGSALDADRVRTNSLKRISVKVFGENREYLTGTLQIALRCKASIHQGFIISKPNFYYQLIASPPLVDPDTGTDSPDTVRRLMQAYAANIEQHLREHADHVSRI